MKLFLILLASASLTACGSMDEFVCRGAGTCYTNAQGQTVMANGSYANGYQTSTVRGGQQVMMPNGGYMIVRSQSTGQIMSVIQTSKTK